MSWSLRYEPKRRVFSNLLTIFYFISKKGPVLVSSLHGRVIQNCDYNYYFCFVVLVQFNDLLDLQKYPK